MNSFEYLKKLEELDLAIQQAVFIAHQVYGTASENEFTERLYKMMHEVQDEIEEVEKERNE
ncbi:hypothetical protein [Geobacillus phage GR1]|nr:hypothetical protein [Geobacillus phage GR1]